MKMKNSNKQRQEGNVMLVALMVTAVLGVSLASYLVMVGTQNRSVYRSQNWNNAIAVTEAGVEEGLSHLNAVNTVPDDLASNGWTSQGGGVYACPRRYLGSNYYDVRITVTTNRAKPYVDCVGTVALVGPFASAPQTMFAAAGVTTQEPKSLARKVEVMTRTDGLLTVVMAALQQIDFSGNNVKTDSFDSTDPNYSTNGKYDSTKTKDHGDVCTDYTITNSFSIGNADIKGIVRTGAKGTATIGANGSVGDKNWVDSGKTGIQAGHFFDDFNVSFPPVKLPAGASLWLPPTPYVGPQIGGVSYSYVLNGGSWKLSQLNGSVLVTGPAKLYVTDRITLSGQSQIRIANTNNASLLMYVGAPTASISGNGVVNDSNVAINFQYLGLPSNTSLGFGANSAFFGCIYAPSAVFTLGGGGNNTLDFIGASVTYSVKMNGHYNFHYDESLMSSGPSRGYIVTSWREL